MAIATAYYSANMEGSLKWEGGTKIDQATPTLLQLGNPPTKSVVHCYGTGLAYSIFPPAVTGGTVNTVDFWLAGVKQYEITGGQYDAATVADYILGKKKGELMVYIFANDDQFNGSHQNDVMNAYAGNDKIYGKGGNDRLNGGAGGDWLDGGAGADILNGGTGNDILIGGAGADKLYGMDGNDILRGGTGNDILYGGAGRDIFRFDTPLSTATVRNIDQIKDFSVVDDTIQLAKSIFTQFTAKGILAADSFVSNNAPVAHDANDYILHDRDDGRIYYDADGNGPGEPVQFAIIGLDLALTNADFVIV